MHQRRSGTQGRFEAHWRACASVVPGRCIFIMLVKSSSLMLRIIDIIDLIASGSLSIAAMSGICPPAPAAAAPPPCGPIIELLIACMRCMSSALMLRIIADADCTQGA